MEINEVEGRILKGLTPTEKLVALLRGEGWPSLRQWAVKNGHFPPDVTAWLNGADKPRVQAGVATTLGFDPSEALGIGTHAEAA